MSPGAETEKELFTRGDLRTTLAGSMAIGMAVAVAQENTTEDRIAPVLADAFFDPWLDEPVLEQLLADVQGLTSQIPWPFGLFHARFSFELARRRGSPLARDFLLHLIEVALLNGEPAIAETYARAGIEDAGGRASPGFLTRCHDILGRALVAQGRLTEANSVFEAGAGIAHASGDTHYEWDLLTSVAAGYYYLGDPLDSRRWALRAEAIARDARDPAMLTKSLGDVGNAELQLGWFDRARLHFESALEAAIEAGDLQRQSDWLGNLGTIRRLQGDLEGAADYASRALALSRRTGNAPSEESDLASLGQIREEQGRWSEAQEHYAAALAIAQQIHADDRVEAYRDHLRYLQQSPPEARPAPAARAPTPPPPEPQPPAVTPAGTAEAAITVETAQLDRAFTRKMRARDAQGARRVVKNFIARHPDRWEGYLYRGVYLNETGRYRESIVAYKKALSLNPAAPQIYHNMLNSWHALGDLETPCRELELSVADQPYVPALRAALGRAYSMMGRHDEALRELREARRLDPMNYLVLAELGELQYAKGESLLSVDWDAAWTYFQECDLSLRQLIDFDEAHRAGALARAGEYYRRMAENSYFANPPILAQFGDRELAVLVRAIVNFLEATKLDPEMVRPRQGLDWATRFLEAVGNARVFEEVGRALRLEGELDLAASYLERAIEMRPDLAEARYELGLVQGDQAGEQPLLLQEAERTLRRASELDPQNPEYAGALRRIQARMGLSTPPPTAGPVEPGGVDAAVLIDRLGRARDLAELHACLDGAAGREALLERAESYARLFEGANIGHATRLFFMLAAEVARSLALTTRAEEAEAGGEAVLAVELFTRGQVDEALSLMGRAADAFGRAGKIGRQCSCLVLAMAFCRDAGRDDDVLQQAERVLEALATVERDPAALSSLIFSGEGKAGTSGELYALVEAVNKQLRQLHLTEALLPYLARWSRLLRRLGLDEAANIVAYQLGRTLVQLGHAESGLEVLFDAHQALRRYALLDADHKQQPLPETTEAAYWLARAYDLAGDHANAEAGYRSHAWWQEGAPEEQAGLVAYLALLLIDEERYQEALNAFEAAPPACDGVLPFAALRSALSAKIYALLSRPGQSASAAADARRALRSLDEHRPDEIMMLACLALVERAILVGDDELAEAAPDLDRIKQASQSRGLAAGMLPIERIEGDLHFATGDVVRALACYRSALKTALAAPSDAIWKREWVDGWDQTLAARVPEVGQRELAAIRRGRGVGAELALRVARAQAALGENADAAFDEAIAGARQRNRDATLFYALVDKAAWLRGRDDRQAIGLLRSAADVLEGLRANMRDVELQIGALTDKEAVYARLLEYAVLPSSDPAEAVRVMERAKSRALLDTMEAGDALPEEAARTDSLDQARTLRTSIVRELRRGMVSGRDAESEARLQRYRDQLSAIYQARYRLRRHQPYPGATPDEVRELAGPGCAVLHFFCGARRIFAAPVIEGGIRPPIALPGIVPDRIHELMGVFSDAIEGRSTRGHDDALGRSLRPSTGPVKPRDAFLDGLKELYAGLIAPLADQLAGLHRLLIVPHDVLHAIPFHALCRPDGRYLLEDFIIAYAPSAAIALRSAEDTARPLPAQARSVAFGVASTVYAGKTLPAVTTEMEALGELVPEVTFYRDDGAVRRKLFALDGALDALHFACHGEFDPVDPLLSRLYLADGPVYAYELLDLGARPRLVVLSACETGAGARRAGDEVFGLVRPFLSRGAAAVVATLWTVDDVSTARLMRVFYTRRREAPDDLPACLRAAQLDLLHSDRYSHPYYWAASFLVGCHPMSRRSSVYAGRS